MENVVCFFLGKTKHLHVHGHQHLTNIVPRHPPKPTSTTFCDQSRSKRRPGATTWRVGLSQGRPRTVQDAPKVPQEPPRRFLSLPVVLILWLPSVIGRGTFATFSYKSVVFVWEVLQKRRFGKPCVSHPPKRASLSAYMRSMQALPKAVIACASPCKGRVQHAWRDKRAADSDWLSQWPPRSCCLERISGRESKGCYCMFFVHSVFFDAACWTSAVRNLC